MARLSLLERCVIRSGVPFVLLLVIVCSRMRQRSQMAHAHAHAHAQAHALAQAQAQAMALYAGTEMGAIRASQRYSRDRDSGGGGHHVPSFPVATATPVQGVPLGTIPVGTATAANVVQGVPVTASGTMRSPPMAVAVPIREQGD